MPAPRFLGYQALLGEPKPINWQGVGQALWDSNLNAPIRGAYNLMNADPYTLYTDTGAAGQQAATDSFDAGGGITVGSAMIPKPSNALTMGIKAYHGSPHSFDKFSMDKIGTGEGAQAYGHGLYFAESEGVAKSYRDALSKTIYKFNKDPDEIARTHGQGVVDTIYSHEGDPKEIQSTIARLRGFVKRDLDEFGVSDVSQLKPQYDGDLASNTIKMAKHADSLEAAIKSGDIALDPGSMYEVNIDADPNAFLDWDKPLSEQPEGVRKAYAQAVAGGDPLLSELMDGSTESLQMAGLFKKSSGAQAYNTFVDGNKEGFTKKLADAGIPGIKYLDAGSRVPSAMAKKELSEWQAQLPLAEKELADATARGDQWLISRKQAEVQRVKDGIARVSKEADGTRNYVVFDDKLISIVKKYGIAGASAMLGYDVLTGANEAQAKAVNKADLDHRYDNFLKSGGI